MNFEILENELVYRLESLIKTGTEIVEGSPVEYSEVEVIAMPENTDEFQRTTRTARITVAFNGLRAKGDEPTLTGGFQDNILTFAIVIQSRLLRGETGAYSLYDQVNKLILGYRLSSCEPLVGRTFELISDEDDIFTFIAFYECSKTSVMQDNGPIIIPTIKELTFESEVTTINQQ